MKAPPPTALDIAAVAFVLLNVKIGFNRAVPGELIKLIALIPAVITFIFSYGPINRLVESGKPISIAAESRPIVAIILTLLAALIVMAVLRRIIERFQTPPSPRDKAPIGNMIAATVYAITFVFLAWATLSTWPIPEVRNHFGDKSLIGRSLARVLPAIHQYMASGPSSPSSRSASTPAKPSVLKSLREEKRVINEISK
jgi:cytochrome c oxidase assembly factor CtaG